MHGTNDEGKVINLSAEEKLVCSKPANSLLFVVKQLNDWITHGNFTEEVKEFLLNLAESYITELRRLL
jgi:hypothetical protein